MPRLLPLTLLLLAAAAHAQSAAPLTIEQAMADPDWIGPSVDQAWWQWDGKQVQYLLKRAGSPVRDTYRQSTAGGTAERVADTARAGWMRQTRATTPPVSACCSHGTGTFSCAICAPVR